MRILVVGAGSIGGYFGGRLLEAGRDVTFLVRPGRAASLARTGLCLRSPAGDASFANPSLVTAETIAGTYDVILLSCKAYDLVSAMDSLAPAMGPGTLILPVLNGMAHLDALDSRFGAAHVLGGLCLISTMLDAEGRILHLAPMHTLTFGARDASLTAQVEAIAALFAGARFDVKASANILQDMWEKWVFIAVAAGLTCLMRGSIGDLMQAGGAYVTEALLGECAAIAASQGFAPREAALTRAHGAFTAAGSAMTASMFRDMEQGGRIESEQILGDLLRRAGSLDTPVLRLAYTHLKTYEARRARESLAG